MNDSKMTASEMTQQSQVSSRDIHPKYSQSRENMEEKMKKLSCSKIFHNKHHQNTAVVGGSTAKT
jgi:hypothetical protein